MECQNKLHAEKRALGTTGALSLLNPTPEKPMVVTNGDVLTDINYGDLLDFHIGNESRRRWR